MTATADVLDAHGERAAVCLLQFRGLAGIVVNFGVIFRPGALFYADEDRVVVLA